MNITADFGRGTLAAMVIYTMLSMASCAGEVGKRDEIKRNCDRDGQFWIENVRFSCRSTKAI